MTLTIERRTVEVGDVWHDRRFPHSIIIEHGAGGRYVVRYPGSGRRATLSTETITELYVRDTIGDPQR